MVPDTETPSASGTPEPGANGKGLPLQLAAGFLLALRITLGAFSFSRLIFSGPLSEYAGPGFGSAMLAAARILSRQGDAGEGRVRTAPG